MTDRDTGGSLAETLAAAFDGFEAIRRLARSCEDSTPDLFAAFMSAASAAADGRDAAGSAPALADHPAHGPAGILPGSEADPDDAADLIAGLAATLAARLEHATGQA